MVSTRLDSVCRSPMEPSLLCMEPVQRVLEASRQMAFILLGTGAASDRSDATPTRERRFTLPALGTAASLVAVRASSLQCKLQFRSATAIRSPYRRQSFRFYAHFQILTPYHSAGEHNEWSGSRRWGGHTDGPRGGRRVSCNAGSRATGAAHHADCFETHNVSKCKCSTSCCCCCCSTTTTFV